MAEESHIHWTGVSGEIINYQDQNLEILTDINPSDPLGALYIQAEGFVGSPLFLPNSTFASPVWDPIPGTSPVIEVRQDGNDPVTFIRVRSDNSATLGIAISPLVTSGTIVATTGSAVQVGPDLVVPAVEGDIIELSVSALSPDTGGPLYWNAATRVSSADVNYFGTGTNTWAFPAGGISSFYTPPSIYTGPRAARAYTVQSGDISGGNVTVRVYARAEASDRDILASSSQPLQTRLVNYGQ